MSLSWEFVVGSTPGHGKVFFCFVLFFVLGRKCSIPTPPPPMDVVFCFFVFSFFPLLLFLPENKSKHEIISERVFGWKFQILLILAINNSYYYYSAISYMLFFIILKKILI